MNADQRLTRVFVELADTLVDEFDVLDFLHTLTERTVELLRADAAGVILNDQHGHLKVAATTTGKPHVVELFELQNEEGPALDCFNSRNAVANIDLVAAAARWPRFSAASVAAGYRSTHAVPLRLRGQVIGAMNMFCTDQITLGADQLAVGRALADIATIGLLQERAVRESQLIAEQLQAALSSRVLIEQAKGILHAASGLGIDDAFRLMRGYSRSNHLSLRDVAASVIDGTVTAEQFMRR